MIKYFMCTVLFSLIFQININIFAKDVDLKKDITKNAHFILAVDAQNINEIKKLIKQGININKQVEGLRALHIAITHANVKLVELLLNSGASIESTVKFNNKKYNAIDITQWNIDQCREAISEYSLKLEQHKTQCQIHAKQPKIEKVKLIEELCSYYDNILKSYQEILVILTNYNIKDNNTDN